MNYPSLVMTGIMAIAGQTPALAETPDDIGLSFELKPVQLDKLTQDRMLFHPMESDLNQTALFSDKLQADKLEGSSPISSSTRVSVNPQALAIAAVPDAWWQAGSDSPVAVAIGAAEGTRQPDGAKNPAYYWHTDPGNSADNFGTFSYQHLHPAEKESVLDQATTADKRQVAAQENLPELADARQLKRLQQFHDRLRQQAYAKGLTLSELELINGLDLANQSEAAALSIWGYIDRLAQMKDLVPDDPEEQIKEARTWSYWDPDYHTWDAPGLGNTYANIRWDQERRFNAVKIALNYQKQNQRFLPQNHRQHFLDQNSPDRDTIANQIIMQDLRKQSG